ncbi:MAG TPA: transcription-repair coupling factor, partial [Gemmataceae bacterium]
MPPALAVPHKLTALTDLPALLTASEGWPELLAALRARRSGTIDGAWGSSAALAAAGLAREAPSVLLVVIPHIADLEQWALDLASFAGERPTTFPAWETWPPEATAGPDPVAAERLRVLQRLAGGPPRLLLTTPAALMQPVPSPEELAARGRRVRTGETLDPEAFARWLVDQGYRRVEAVAFPGDFSARGGILDVWSIDAEVPFRVELFG